MNRVDRLFGILIALQSKRYVTADQLAQKFGISIRTVYRDIKALGELGVPVSFEAPKGYFIVQGYFLPPLSFTTEEANALLLLASLAEKFADKSIVKHSESALSKIKAILRYSDKDKVEQLQTQTKVYRQLSGQQELPYLAEIQNSIYHRHILKIDYQNNQQEKSSREIEPIGLIFYSMDWHIIAWCWKRHAYRDFKVCRVQKLQSTGVSFRKSEHINLDEYIKTLE